jgi:uncharacterized ion transporter superfamily protein YfcC
MVPISYVKSHLITLFEIHEEVKELSTLQINGSFRRRFVFVIIYYIIFIIYYYNYCEYLKKNIALYLSSILKNKSKLSKNYVMFSNLVNVKNSHDSCDYFNISMV